jgi:hypothetical protein
MCYTAERWSFSRRRNAGMRYVEGNVWITDERANNTATAPGVTLFVKPESQHRGEAMSLQKQSRI